MMKKKNKKIVGILGMAAAAVAVVAVVKKRKVIAKKAEDVKEQGALTVHKRIGMPVYSYLKDKNYIPF
tara:strand:- start:235 stop:438 length:204 start_codon:yes stop_codon:yes gene_type:complete